MKQYRLNIDGKEVLGVPGQTILEVARENDISIPTLCYDERTTIYGACGLCVVEVEGNPKLVKACATEIAPNMVVRTKTKRVLESRKTNLELLLSNHVGDCRPPCVLNCPAGTDCQGYVGLIANGRFEEAIALIRERIPLPGSIGRVCPHPCEDNCRRALVDQPVAIAWLKRFAADWDQSGEDPFLPEIAPETGRSVAIIGGADGPMVLFGTLMMKPELFVSVSIIAYLYLSLTYAGYPYIIKALVPKKYRGIDIEFDMPQVSQKAKFIFIVVVCLLLCLLLPVAAPLMLSFFLGMAVKEAKILPYQELLEGGITSFSSLFLGLVLGCLCEASTILNPTVGIILILGILALAISAVGGIAGGWLMYFVGKKTGKSFNPAVGIAGISCMPTTTKLAQHAVEEENPFAIVIPIAMGCNISGVIVSAIAAGVFVATIGLVL